jgi:hypothetical protein
VQEIHASNNAAGTREPKERDKMKLWRAWYRYADYECQATVVLTVGATKAEVDESLLLHYESLKPEDRYVSLGCGDGDDLLEIVAVGEFDSGEIWDC